MRGSILESVIVQGETLTYLALVSFPVGWKTRDLQSRVPTNRPVGGSGRIELEDPQGYKRRNVIDFVLTH